MSVATQTRAERVAAAEEAKLRAQLALIRRQEKIQAARENLLDYIEFTMPDPDDPNDVSRSRYEAALHHKAICKAVQTFVEGGFEGYDILILATAFRHGKTEIVSKKLPSWYSGKHPTESVVVGTYSDEFAMDIGAEVRDHLYTPQHKQVFPAHKLRRGGTAKDRMNTTEGGLLYFVGRGAALTGRGANLLILDDILKSDDEARSKTIRDQAWNWLTRVAMTRRMGKKRMIITMTRWHVDDPVGRLIDPRNTDYYHEDIAKKIKVIELPGIAEENDALGRAPGEALWPERFSAEYLNSFKKLDPMLFSAMIQQKPSVVDGTLFKRENFHFYSPSELPTDLRYYCASDHAVSLEQRSDSTVLIKVGVDQVGHIWVLDCWWKKAPTDEVVEAMLAMGTGPRAPLVWWAEKGHISKSIGPFLRKRMMETDKPFNLVEVTPARDKEQRAQAISARMALGYVHFPVDAPWTHKATEQLLAFPNDAHDDFVDAFAYIGLGLRVQTPASAPANTAKEPKYGTFGWLKRQQQRDADEARRLRFGGF